MLIAISAHPESQQVERFGHEFPILLLDIDGMELRSSRQLAPQAGCCGTLARRLVGADVLICTGLGQGAARHLHEIGVDVAVVPEGVAVTAALASWTTQALQPGGAQPTDCHGGASHGCGGHDGEEDEAEAVAHQCSCGSHDTTHD